MALKAIMLRKRIDEKKKALDAVRARQDELQAREAEIEKAISEAETDEERSAVESTIDEHEAAKTAAEQEALDLNKEIEELEGQLAEEERAQNTEPVKEPEKREKKETKTMENRKKFFGLGYEERSAMFEREDVQSFLANVRTCMKEKRALTNVGLLIPEVFLGIIRENVIDYSKLYKHVNVRRIGGEGRMVVMGTVPEAVWTECCATLNELDLSFNDVEVDCNKLGAYFAVCNAILEDSDINLANELITALLQAVGLALDKAILYGTGTKMPLGVMARLAQTAQPAGYPATARPWVDLHSTNMIALSDDLAGTEMFSGIVLASGAASSAYSRGEKVWIMNERTYTTLMANAVEVDSAGAIVAGVNGRMPVAGGVIEVLNFMPNNTIICGYFDLYLLVERGAVSVAQSEHARFIEDRTVFKGTARYDGQPVIPEAFVAIGLGGTPTASMTFAPDTANA